MRMAEAFLCISWPRRVVLLAAIIYQLTWTVDGVIVRDYNRVNFVELNTFGQFEERFVFTNGDQQRIVNTNLVLGVAKPECYHLLESPALRGAQRHAAGEVLAAATLPAVEFPFKIFDESREVNVETGYNCAQAIFYSKGSPLDQPKSTTQEFPHSEINQWLASQVRMQGMTMSNGFEFPITVYYQEESQDPVFQGVLNPGESFTSSSFLGHVFSASALDPVSAETAAKIPGLRTSNDAAAASVIGGDTVHPSYLNLVDFFVVDSNQYTFGPWNRIQTCELRDSRQQEEQEQRIEELLALGADHQLECDNLYLRLVEFTHKVWYAKRLGLNYVQPQFVEPVTGTGFEHRRLPEETYKWLREWYLREQLQQQIVESSSGPCMNQHVAPSGVTHLTASYKDRLSAELKDTLEDWHGAPLELTSIYGVRRYNNGSVLRMHVDTVNTHVVSAIINVDQEVEQDWPLLILDHEDNEHYLVMQPGDMVLYESAKLLHGRPDPFIGSHYDNIFIHYKPVQGWNYDWL